jgi:hypothetical protein
MECEVCGRNEREVRIRKTKGMQLCAKHISQLYRHGCFNDDTIYCPNEIAVEGNIAFIVLKDKQCNIVAKALIDIEDVERCKMHKWHLHKGKYVIASLKENQKIHLHRFVLSYSGTEDVDHINRNPLDNRKCNLRIVPHNVNSANNDGVGVVRSPSGKYQARVCRNYKSIHIGTFETFDEAHIARKRFVEQYDRMVGH